MDLKDLADELPEKNTVETVGPAIKSDPLEVTEDTKWVVLELRILDNEQILFVFDKKHLREARKAHPDMVVYFPPEMRELYQFKDKKESFQKVHLVKKTFKGWIVPSTIPEKGGGEKLGSKKRAGKKRMH